ncbi:hypothetical protein DO97_01470 [Neosynechococcus sphagnicola sy1]|uniref:Ysc84 actin-binding domain-containing protein n=1 Tax=Neosynechococcus sphagnicola sy1 TaxID=1497020 RepID=A0A098TLL6_9CYAN|nr:lipid-binding SYLF domain-containing protein [Neosynechococcus sphagnicola]KGF73205.1 hypothetical protein DO97_01470 [Neosynechococcus sphagnicola sy1]
MNLRAFLAVPVAMTVMVSSAYPVLASQSGAIDTVQSATRVFDGVMSNPKSEIPIGILRRAQAIAIFPNVVKAGFIVGGSRGRGILAMRGAKGGWSNPVFLTITSGSVGFQIGAASSDIVLVFMNKRSVETALTNDFTLGGSVSVAAGPVGKDAVSPNDAQSTTDIFSYTRNQGLFAGVSLEGSKTAVDRDRNGDFYGQSRITVQQIVTNPDLPTPPAAAEFKRVLARYIPPR